MNRTIDIVFEGDLSKKEAALHNLSVLYGTREGEQALDRSFGLDWTHMDKPTELAKALFTTEIIEKTSKYVPTVSVTSVTFTADIEGRLTPTVSVEEAEK